MRIPHLLLLTATAFAIDVIDEFPDLDFSLDVLPAPSWHVSKRALPTVYTLRAGVELLVGVCVQSESRHLLKLPSRLCNCRSLTPARSSCWIRSNTIPAELDRTQESVWYLKCHTILTRTAVGRMEKSRRYRKVNHTRRKDE